MSYDEALAQRLREAVTGLELVTEKKMFGGLALLRDGKMFCGIVGTDLMVRVGPERHDEALARPHVRTMDFTGKPMRGYVFVAPPGHQKSKDVEAWVRWSVAFVDTLPAKRPSRKKAR